MIDPILNAKEKLDDPLMLEWALRYYKDLPENNREEKAHIESSWFHDLFIAQLIERNETETLLRLFNTLPAQHFSSFTNLIIKRWLEWPTSLANATIQILAVNAPKELLHLLESYLNKVEQGAPFEIERLLSIYELSETGIDTSYQPLLNRLCQKVLLLPKIHFGRMFFLPSLLRLGNGLSFDMHASLLEAALQSCEDNDRRRSVLIALIQGVFGHKEYLDIVFDRSEKQSEQHLESLVYLFQEETPLTQLDQWLDSPPAFSEVIPMLEKISYQSSGCKRILSLLKDSSRIKRQLPDAIRSQLVVATCIHGFARTTFENLAPDLKETVDLLSGDFLKPHWYPALLAHLRTYDQQDITTALISRLPYVRHTYGGVQLAEVMGDLAWAEFVPCLIDSITQDQGDYLCEASQTALKKIGISAQAALIEFWDQLDWSQQIFGLPVISDIGGKAAADFAYEHFDTLMADNVEFYCKLALAAPDKRLLDRLKPELRRQQPLIDCACYILARLLDQDDDEIQAAKKRAIADLTRQARNRKSFESGDLSNDSLYLELHCPSCNGVNQYAVKGVIIGKNQDEKIPHLINDEFPCASCGQYVEFELTSSALTSLTAEMLMMKAAHENEQQPSTRITTMSCQVDGHTLPAATALEKLREHVAKSPNDASAWFQLGKILAYINRPKAGIQALSQALQLEPAAIDVKLMLANALVLNDANEEAFQILTDALNQLADWEFLVPQSNFGQDFAKLYNQLRRSLGRDDLPALHPSSLKTPQKTGRNDPCPCGSGKKFKKCCGR
ncbi:TPR domain-containing protein [Nitrosomonas supralitoralis]|uniref:TPR domain-containing protein n=1 Tax=Nitrosomonas supralitoralis TaxID=2116706 RepID=UPI001F5B6ADC|nr:SEC-C metal-binding domain-containing protein [Nitrosomonas supralitoralis]